MDDSSDEVFETIGTAATNVLRRLVEAANETRKISSEPGHVPRTGLERQSAANDGADRACRLPRRLNDGRSGLSTKFPDFASVPANTLRPDTGEECGHEDRTARRDKAIPRVFK